MVKIKLLFSVFLISTILYPATVTYYPFMCNTLELNVTSFGNYRNISKEYKSIKGVIKIKSRTFYDLLSKSDFINSNKIKGIFSWSKSQALTANRNDTYNLIDNLNINEIYQSGLFKISTEERINFIRDLKSEKNVDVYELTGDPNYFNDLNDYKRKIDLVKNYNDSVSDNAKLKGIVFDVEPWVLGDGNWTQKEYAVTIKDAYTYAKSYNINLVIVIPFWLDENISEIIIKNSDKTIVMNYNITAPVKFIKEELNLAKKYNKPISTAAETQASSSDHGVNDKTTYYYVGVDRLIEDWKAISLAYNYDKLEFSLHNFNSVKEFIN